MGTRTKIEWTRSPEGSDGATWTPIRARWIEPTNDGGGRERVGWHCEHVSEGCRNCYSEAFNKRLGTGLDFKPGALFREEKRGYHNGDAHLFLDEKMLLAPLRWKRPRRIFVCSMTDLFADFVSDEWIDRVFAVMQRSSRHTFQVLTKRSARMREYIARLYAAADPNNQRWFDRGFCWPLESMSIDAVVPFKNVWLGVSAEDQRRADERVSDLLATPAAVRFVSAEPLIGPIDFNAIRWVDEPAIALLDWIITGGESGPSARPSATDWYRGIRDQCATAGVYFFHKQNGEFLPAIDPYDGLARDKSTGFPMVRVGKKRAGRLLDGVEHNEFPREAS